MLPCGAPYLDTTRPRLLRLREAQRQHAILERCVDVLGINGHGEREGTREASRATFAQNHLFAASLLMFLAQLP
ncbi:MAG TPA: hypothetical protein VFD73_12430, partial [Gemmatimonadales bacterium]|nr:hypothetical protein [Gemmatimonadales bacterium]